MIILSFDQSISNTGWAVIDTEKPESAIRTGSIKSSPRPRMSDEEQFEIFGRSIKKLFTTYRPDFVAWEAPFSFIKRYKKKGGEDLAGKFGGGLSTVNPDQLKLRDLQGQIRQSCIDWRVPWEKATPSTWRAISLGNGNGNLKKEVSKKKAKEHCRLRRIECRNGDEAEAALIGIWCWRASQHFKLLQSKKVAA